MIDLQFHSSYFDFKIILQSLMVPTLLAYFMYNSMLLFRIFSAYSFILYSDRRLMLLHMQAQLVILASQVLEDSKASQAHKVPLETLALQVLQVKMVLLDHLDHRDLKAIKVQLAQLVNQDQTAELVTLAFRASLVCAAQC